MYVCPCELQKSQWSSPMGPEIFYKLLFVCLHAIICDISSFSMWNPEYRRISLEFWLLCAMAATYHQVLPGREAGAQQPNILENNFLQEKVLTTLHVLEVGSDAQQPRI